MKRFFLGLAVLVAPIASIAGASYGTSVRNWGPNGNGTLDHKDDQQWVGFHDAQVTADAKAGTYTARFGPLLQKMDGQPIAISGYMMPLGTMLESNHFILPRRSPGCPFCPPNEPMEAIEVFSSRFVKGTQLPITVEGRLRLVGNSERGLFLRIDAARIW